MISLKTLRYSRCCGWTLESPLEHEPERKVLFMCEANGFACSQENAGAAKKGRGRGRKAAAKPAARKQTARTRQKAAKIE
eukprot:scaffold19034_cov36-Prasinocladus_malaysianus.AAC.2